MKKFKVGLQLYSIREEMEKDMDSALKTVKDMGYDYVEFAGYFGKTAVEVNEILNKYDLTAISVHQAPLLFFEEGQKAVDFLKEIGVKYAIIPWYDKTDFVSNWDETVKKFTTLGELLKNNDIMLGYHNHDFELESFKDSCILDELLKAIPSEVFVPEFDTCWLKYAKCNPVDYINKYSDRVEILHLKDYVSADDVQGAVYGLIDKSGSNNTEGANESADFMFKPLGQGCQDFTAILEAAEKANTEYVIVEQDRWDERGALCCAKESREYLKNTFGI